MLRLVRTELDFQLVIIWLKIFLFINRPRSASIQSSSSLIETIFQAWDSMFSICCKHRKLKTWSLVQRGTKFVDTLDQNGLNKLYFLITDAM